MDLKLVSQQLVFQDGDVSLLPYFEPQDALPSSLERTQLRSNFIENLSVAMPGRFLLLIGNCLVESRQTGLRRWIRAVTVPATVTADDITRGLAAIDVDFHAFVRIEVVGNDDKPLSNQPIVGVLDEATLEGHVNQEGHLDVLLRPGKHMAYLYNQPTSMVWFMVQAGQEDAGTIKLRFSKE